MLDEFRQQADTSSIFQEEDEDLFEEELPPRPARRILGMTAPQRFLIAFMLLLAVCILGLFFLLVTGRIALPFF